MSFEIDIVVKEKDGVHYYSIVERTLLRCIDRLNEIVRFLNIDITMNTKDILKQLKSHEDVLEVEISKL